MTTNPTPNPPTGVDSYHELERRVNAMQRRREQL